MSLRQTVISNTVDDISLYFKKETDRLCDTELSMNVIPKMIIDMLREASHETLSSIIGRLSSCCKGDIDELVAIDITDGESCETISQFISDAAYDSVNLGQEKDEIVFLCTSISIILFCAEESEFYKMKSVISNVIDA